MVQKCYSCGSAKTDNVKLHGFPKNVNLREKWVAQIKKDVPIIITQYTRLCSKHFTNDDYYQSSFGNDILKPDAVPSRFFCSRKSLLSEFEVHIPMSTESLSDKPILTVNDNLENLMLEEEIVVTEDENNSAKNLSDKPIATVFDNLENLMLEEEIVVDEDENNSTDSMNNDTYYDTEVTTLQANENINITKVHLSEKKRKLLRYAGDFSEEDLETPGLTRESFQAISIKVNEMKIIGKQLYGCLIIDEMSIKQHVQWTGSRHQGYVDYGQGGGTDSMDNLPYAKDAFVIMVVGLNSHWKVPIAYYLVNGISLMGRLIICRWCLCLALI